MQFYHSMTLAGGLLLAGVLSNKLSSRFNMPILLMFLGVGMIFGSDGLNIISLQSTKEGVADNINQLGIVAMCFILFSGGMSTKFRSIKPILLPGGGLATAGVALTALFLGLCCCAVQFWATGDCNFMWCMLLAALISSTDAAAVFAILRGRGVSLRGELQPLLEFESGSNDPMAALLTLFLIPFITQSVPFSFWKIPQLIYQLGAATALGVGIGVLGSQFFKLKLEYEGLYYVLGVAIVLLGYGSSEMIHANGFLTAYVSGLTMGNLKFNYRAGLTKFNEGIGWLMQVVLFTTLGLLVNPRDLCTPRVFGSGLLLAVALMFVARPAAVFLCLLKSSLSFREKLLISWAGLRGAAPIVLATFPLAAGIKDASLMFNLIFFMVISSVLLQGLTLMPLARLLKLDKPLTDRARPPLELETLGDSRQEMYEFEVLPDSPLTGVTLAQAQLPVGVLITMLRRNDAFEAPRGSTEIQAGDGLLALGTPEKLQEMAAKFFPGADYHPAREFDLKRELRKPFSTSTNKG